VKPPAGFTLIEVLVAIIITAMVALLSHQIAGTVADHARRARDVRRATDREGNAYALLRSAFLSLEVGRDSAPAFLGNADRLQFSTWLTTADGWPERRTLELALRSHRWVASAPPDADVVLAEGLVDLHFDFLVTAGAAPTWVRQWESTVSAPLAVRIRVTWAVGPSDTLLFLIKSRG
jgi:prepilin-type N-terminal cleavage/methylation domain-containing protein